MNRTPSALDWAVFFFLGAIWGCSFLFIKKSVQVFTPEQATAWRMTMAWAVYLPVAAIYWKKIDWKRWPWLLGVAMFGSGIPNFLFSVAQRHVDSGLAGVLNSLAPLFALLIGMLVLRHKVSPNKMLGVGLGLLGAIILVLYSSGGKVSGHTFYAMLCVVATICYATNANIVNARLRDMSPAAIGAGAFLLAGPFFVFMLWREDGWGALVGHERGWEALGYLFYLAAVSTVAGSIVYFWLLQRTSAIFATSTTYLLPIAALILGVLDGENLTIMHIIGATVILTGVYLTRK